MHYTVDELLRKGVHDDSHRYQIADRGQPASKQFLPALTIKQHTLYKRRIACLSVGSPATDSKHDRDQGLQDESQASGTLEPFW